MTSRLLDVKSFITHVTSLDNVSCRSNSSKGKRSIAVRKKPHRYGNSRAICDHTVLPATRRGDIPAFTPAEAGTRSSDPGGMQG